MGAHIHRAIPLPNNSLMLTRLAGEKA